MPQPGIPHRTVFAQHPLATLALSFAVGIITARFVASSLLVFMSCAGVCSILVVYTFAKRKHSVASIFLLLAFLFLGGTLAIVEKRSVASNRIRKLYDEGIVASGDPVEVTGVLDCAPEPAPDGFYLTLNVEKIRIKNEERSASGAVSLFASMRDKEIQADYESLELRYGARVSVMTALRRSDSFRNPGVSSFKDFLEQRGLDATGTIKSPLLIERLDDERVFLPLAWLYEWRQSLLSSIDRRFSPDTAGVLAAAMLGNRYQLSRGTAERFREGGTFHVLVISGLHISFIGVIVLLIARRVTKKQSWQFTFTVLVLWSYTLAVGAEASVVRAALMFSVVALAPVLQRRSSSLNALGGAGLALLVWRPSDLFDPSFQLTFLSVVAIVAVAWPLLSRLQEVGVWRPTHETPSPPVCARWWRVLGELLYWSERAWQDEMKDSPWRCRLFKSRHATRLEKLHLQRLTRYVVGVVVVSTSVQLVLLPFLILYFHRVSFASLFLNIIVGVLMALLSVCALAALVVSEISNSLGTSLVSLTEAINWLMVHSVDPFETMRLASIRLPEYSGWPSIVYGLYYVPLVTLTVKLARWKPVRHPSGMEKRERFSAFSVTRVAAFAFMIGVIIVVWHPRSAPAADSKLHVDFLDVGQGDAALVTMPDGTTVLIDGGGQPSFDNSRRYEDEGEAAEPFQRDRRSVGEAVVSEYLWWRGLDHVDYIVATHADADHIDGLNAIARNFGVRCAMIAREPSRDPEYSRFAATLRDVGVPAGIIARGDSLRFGSVTLDVLWPVHLADANAPSLNNDSIVLRMRFGERVFLLTGDIEKGAEAALTRDSDELKCDVLKVAHHGSRSSSIDRFVSATRPSLAVISVGLSSAYGHPHKEVVERWRASGAEVLTTGQSGMISVSTDGRDLKVNTYVTNPDLKEINQQP